MIDPNEPAQSQSPLLSLLENPSESFIGRRKIIGTLGLATTALCASSISAKASWFGKKDELPIVKVKSSSSNRYPAPKNLVGDLPEEWVRAQGRNLNDYATYLATLKMRNISAMAVISAHAKNHGTVWNTLPPRQWWARMGYTLRVIDRISSEMNIPVKEIVSAYRCPRYNARCNGAKAHSWHQANVAVDVQFETSARNVTTAARSLRDRGLFKGGVGSYPNFTHIDTRGTNVNW